MAVTALLLYAVAFVLLVVVRMVMQRARTGATGLALKAEPGSVAWWAGLGLFAGVAVAVAAPIADLAGMDRIAALDHGGVALAGVVVATAGIGATFLAQLQMGASWRIGVDASERTALVRAGLFGLVRNPIFSLMGVMFVGLFLMVPNWLAIAAVVILVVDVEVHVRRVEEPYLLGVHGDDYRAFTAEVGRFVPGVGRARSSRP